MKAIIVGCGRVGSALARSLADEGWEVVVVEQREESLTRLGNDWRHAVVIGHGMDADVLEEAGIADADMVIAATDGDNTNLIIAQVATKRYEVDHVAARIQDPARAEVYGDRGFEVISPVKMAIEGLTGWALQRAGGDLMFAIIVGGGKMGSNLTRTLAARGHEVVVVEAKPARADVLEDEFGHRVVHGDGTELYVLESAGITRPPDIVVAVTGDDEDNMIIAQLAREKYGVPKVIARVNDPRNQVPLRPPGHLAHDLPDPADHGPDRARGPRARAGAPAGAAPREPGDHRGRGRPQVPVHRQDGRRAWGCRPAPA